MSEWRLRGFVQDSDEEEDFEISSANANRESQRVSEERVGAAQSSTQNDTKNRQSGRSDGLREFDAFDEIEATARQRMPNETPTLTLPSPTPIIPLVADVRLSQPSTPLLNSNAEGSQDLTESPDPLQASPSPTLKRTGNLPSSSLSLGAHIFSQGVPTANQNAKRNFQAGDRMLEDFGIAPLSDTSQSDVLSDPPSDIGQASTPNTVFASPKHRTAVQVVIPRATAVQLDDIVSQEKRTFRERKPVQVHPYIVENERYRRELQGRGIKPVPRARSPTRNPGNNNETQERAFHPEDDRLASSPPEIPVSTPISRKSKQNDKGALSKRPRSSLRIRRSAPSASQITSGAKRRKLDHSLTQASRSRRRAIESHDASAHDIWSIPHSPPYSSSPGVTGTGSSLRRLARPLAATPGPNLPTPSQSSSLREDVQPLSDSDPEVVVRSVRALRQQLRHPSKMLAERPPESERSVSESEPSESELRRVKKRIKGVLPASWLRLDREKQDKRRAQVRDHSNGSQSPERVEPQRGVAQKIVRRRGSPRARTELPVYDEDALMISDESDVERNTVPRHIIDIQRSAQEANSAAALFDLRYVDDDSDDMEHDQLDLFPQGGSSKKRSKQTKILDAFARTKNPKLPGDSSKNNGASHTHNIGRAKHSTTRGPKRTPLPALSVLDFDQSPSKGRSDLPQFLRIAKRQASRRPDHARQRPTQKHIRLHTMQDTEDAHSTLLQWQKGSLKPKANPRSSNPSPEVREALVDLGHNLQRSRRLSSPKTSVHKDKRSTATAHALQPRQQQDAHPGLLVFRRHHTSGKAHSRRDAAPSSLRSNSHRTTGQGLLPFRKAQLEIQETNSGRSRRTIAFEEGLQRVETQFNSILPIAQPSRNPQLARFLAEDDAPHPLIPPIEDPEDRKQKSPVKKVRNPKRRLVNKAKAQRVDVDLREYRQPSEPLPEDLFQIDPPRIQNEQSAEQKLSVLLGLGPYGTRYLTTFDVWPLKSGTYFHSSTFVGGEEFRRALSNGKEAARNLDEPVGYCTIQHHVETVRCGPWDDKTYSVVTNWMNTIWNPSADLMTNKSDQAKLSEDAFRITSKLLRNLINYISTRLSFLDPPDKASFVSKMRNLVGITFDRIVENSTGECNKCSEYQGHPEHMRTSAYLLVLTMQIRQIAKHSMFERAITTDLECQMREITKFITVHLLRRVSELNNFLERNKRWKEREDGIRDSDVLVESLVISTHVSSIADIPGQTFWDFVSRELSFKTEKVEQLVDFESLWGTLFTLLPFHEFDDRGILDAKRRSAFHHDNWTAIKDLVNRLFILYPSTYRSHNSSVNDYVRATLTRCHVLIDFWHWRRCDSILSAIFDFFGKNGLKQLRREESGGSAHFLENLAENPSFSVQPSESSFHIFLKCLALGLSSMRHFYPEKKIRSIVFRLTPNHGRNYPKDQPLEAESLDALRNHHDLLCTLYWASPPSCRPKLDLIRSLVHHETSHREACRLSVRAWANLTAFQLSTNEPYESARPLAEWHKEIMLQTLRQYRLAKTEADDYLKSAEADTCNASSLMVRQMMKENQDQAIGALRDCIAGMHRALEKRSSGPIVRQFLMDSSLVQLLELPHFDDLRLVAVIRDALKVLRTYAILPRPISNSEVSQDSSEESQDYGTFPDEDDLDVIDQQTSESDPSQRPLDFIHTPLWRLISNAFGAESTPDDNLLMECIDTWVLIAGCQVTSGVRSWADYVSSFGDYSWNQLRQTEQTRKFSPYFIAAALTSDAAAYVNHRDDFLTALMIALVDREALLRFQYRLLHAIVRTVPDEPLLRNIPFFQDDRTGEVDITGDTLRTRRVQLISSILANMRDHFHTTMREHPSGVITVRGSYSLMLKGLMTAMKNNYQQLRQGARVTGAYVEFVQRIVQFLQQYTPDICPVLGFFLDSTDFPLPATDPTYVIGRLCGYAPKLTNPGVTKQLSVFVETITQQAAANNQQLYLVQQLQTVLCTDEAPPKDRLDLRNVLLKNIFPAYVESAFSSATGLIIAKPVLQSLKSILQTLFYDIRVYDESNTQTMYDSVMSISHAFVRSTEQIKGNALLLQQPHLLHAASLMIQAMVPVPALLDYIFGRCVASSAKPTIIKYLKHFNIFIAEVLHDLIPLSIPSYDGNAHVAETELLHFSAESLSSSIKTNWSADAEQIFFGHGQAKRELVVDMGSEEEERGRLIESIEDFHAAVAAVYDEPEGMIRGNSFLGDLDV